MNLAQICRHFQILLGSSRDRLSWKHSRREGGRRVTGSIGLTWIDYGLNIKIYSQKYWMNEWIFRYFHPIFIVFTKISYPICVDPIFFLFSCLNSNRWRRSSQPTPTRPPSLHSRSFLSFYSTVNPLNNLNNSQVPKVKSERGSVTRPQGSVREREGLQGHPRHRIRPATRR